MDIRQLRYFIAIVQERKISAAAERLHISQPPLSQQLKNMEDELGSKLIVRNGKHFEVTDAGKALYQYALRMTQLMEEAKMEVKEIGNGVNGSLSLGVNTLSSDELPELLKQFKEKFPKVHYKIQQSESAHLCKMVRDREIELAIIRLPLELDDFSILYLYTEPFYFITSKKQKRFDGDVTLEDIKDLPLLLPSTEGLGVYYSIVEAFSRLQLEPNIIGECSDIALLLDLISTDFGTAIVPESLLNRYRGYPIHSHKISNINDFSAPVGLVWLKNHYLSRTAQNFVDLLRRRFC
ncbi:LysR family transcriptional regulator [Bacillus sp. SD088]|uniref:LysR family transcriptional regulator n=1 Tax=Bacillus sp. SD088 TaxID=2782012 RepID=UPI001A9691E8|nr:LysR family transcriptional regulator [Bacillus sp. SD088]MBO0992706.1 LysR family transcriptional regulator [Bacillus sp. SD088]